MQLPQIKCNNQGCKFSKTTHIFLPHMEVSGFAMSFSPTTVCVSRWYLKYGKKGCLGRDYLSFPTHPPCVFPPYLKVILYCYFGQALLGAISLGNPFCANVHPTLCGLTELGPLDMCRLRVLVVLIHEGIACTGGVKYMSMMGVRPLLHTHFVYIHCHIF